MYRLLQELPPQKYNKELINRTLNYIYTSLKTEYYYKHKAAEDVLSPLQWHAISGFIQGYRILKVITQAKFPHIMASTSSTVNLGAPSFTQQTTTYSLYQHISRSYFSVE